MPPEEKAKDIYDKMKGFRVKNSHRKKCALICAQEFIDDTQYDEHNGYTRNIFWQKVKSILEKQ